SSRRRHTRSKRDWSSDVCSSDLKASYLKDAVDHGAVAYLSEQDYAADIPGIIVEDIRLAMAQLANFFYQSPWQDVAISGITGTRSEERRVGREGRCRWSM